MKIKFKTFNDFFNKKFIVLLSKSFQGSARNMLEKKPKMI